LAEEGGGGGKEEEVRILDLAGGPGGFSEYFLWRCERPLKIVGSTLAARAGGISYRLERFNASARSKLDQLQLVDGDLLSAAFRRELSSFWSKPKQHLVVCDGGFDVAGKEDRQEELHTRLIAAELSVAVASVARGGTVVCKLFSLHTVSMVSVLHLVGSAFERWTLVKPVSSRPTNSEQYLVAVSMRLDEDEADHVVSRLNEFVETGRELPRVEDEGEEAARWFKKHNRREALRQISALSSLVKEASAAPLGGGDRPESLNEDCKNALAMWKLPPPTRFFAVDNKKKRKQKTTEEDHEPSRRKK
jgi:cap1 methyltransferase